MDLFGTADKQDILAGLERFGVPETMPVFIESFLAIAEGKNIFEMEGVCQTYQGQGKRVLVKCMVPPRHQGTYDRVLVSVINITERSRLEEQWLQSQKMEAVGLLAGGVAHDFRNQLTVIRGYAEMLLRRGLVTGKALDAMREILKAADRSAVLTGELLTFSRKQVLRPEVIDLADRADRPGQAAVANHRRGRGTPRPAGHRAGHVKADRGLLQQAIMNVVVNARDAMPTGGRLTIALRDVELDESFLRSHVALTPAPTWRSPSRTLATGWTPRRRRGSSSRSSPPSPPARAPAWGWRWSTASSSRVTATSAWTASRGRARRSGSTCPARRSPWPPRSPPPAAASPRHRRRDHPGGRG